MNILYYTSGSSGIGRLVHGMAIGNALARSKAPCEFTILSSAPAERAAFCDRLDIAHREIPGEKATDLTPGRWERSALYQSISELKPDVLVIDRMWFTLHHFIQTLRCEKVFLCSRVDGGFFMIESEAGRLAFRPETYERVIITEPFTPPFKADEVNPLIIRNRNEILPREKALAGLGLSGEKKAAFVGMNFRPGYPEELMKRYDYLSGEGWEVVYSTNLYGEGVFPLADYYNAVDLIITSATYNAFWESRYFDKEAVFETVPVNFCDQEARLREMGEHSFEENGADQLAKILLKL